MRIIAVEDEKALLEGLVTEIGIAAPGAEVCGFRSGEEALAYAAELKNSDGGVVDIAFLDIDLRDMNGITLGEELLRLYPNINLIYATGYREYAVQAIDQRCSGYIIKPVTADLIRHELENLRNPVSEQRKKRLSFKAFGKFEAYVDGKPIQFDYKKTKELLAYLVNRRGELVTNAEIFSALWEDDTPAGSHRSYYKNIRTDLLKKLAENDLEECIVRLRGEIGILPNAIDCDYYDYLNNPEEQNIDQLLKEGYMSQYSWGEFTLATLYSDSGKFSGGVK